jgi:hypothetical protein
MMSHREWITKCRWDRGYRKGRMMDETTEIPEAVIMISVQAEIDRLLDEAFGYIPTIRGDQGERLLAHIEDRVEEQVDKLKGESDATVEEH